MMRKILLSILVIITLLSYNEAKAQFRYGPMASLDITNLSFKQDLIEVDPTVGYSAGIISEMMFPGIGFGIDAGFLYSQRGATMNLGEKEIWASDGYGKERAYLHYIEIPVHLRFKYTRLNGIEDYVAPFVYAGPSFSLLVGHGNLKALEYAGGDIGITVGLGAEILKNWQVSGSYTWGTTYSLKTVKLKDFSARNRAWSIKIAYLF